MSPAVSTVTRCPLRKENVVIVVAEFCGHVCKDLTRVWGVGFVECMPEILIYIGSKKPTAVYDPSANLIFRLLPFKIAR